MNDKFEKYQKLKKEAVQREYAEGEKLQLLDSEIKEILNTFKNNDGSAMVTYESLSRMEFDKWFDLENGVKFMRIEHPTKEVFFITEMNPEESSDGIARFGKQEHDCKEICVVTSGELIETYEMCKHYDVNETVIYPAYYTHKPIAKIKSTYEVEFINPNK